MSVTAVASPVITYRSLFPSWEGRRPVAWFFAENLLEARAESDFPTNSAGCDEDVNVYLIGLLSSWATTDPRRGVDPGLDPVLGTGPLRAPVRARAEYLRRQADHRLLMLGLHDRGDLVRRRCRGWMRTRDETRRLDVSVARSSYERAADLLDGRAPGTGGLVAVWRKLAVELPAYVHVLQTLARRRLGLGARLQDGELERLLAEG